ncbi:hypothetical protein Tco_0624028 [Tanacetum coccineum]|uniref:Uncharacterized protein n=1 Tax=Tanacetum coccineum TaxID=301880 RepID=A0ABQ4WCS8_9ASTR
MDVNEKLIVAIEDSNSKPWWLTDNNKILIGSTRNFDAEPMVLMILTGATKLMLHQLSHNAFNGYNTESCIGFGIESSNSMESNISSGDETLTDSAYENFKREKAYKAVPPPTGTIIPPRANVSFTGIDELAIRNKVVNQEKTKSSQSAIDRNKVIIEDWVDSDDEETDVSESQKETAFNSENSETSFENRSTKYPKLCGQETRTKGLGNKGGKLCFVCYSPNHLIKDCNLHERTFKHTQTHKPKGTQGSRETRPVWNNIQRVNHSNFSRNSRYPHQRRSFIPSALLTRDWVDKLLQTQTITTNIPSKSTANVTYQGTARSRVPQAVLSRSTDGSYYPRMDNRRPRISSYSPSYQGQSRRRSQGLCHHRQWMLWKLWTRKDKDKLSIVKEFNKGVMWHYGNDAKGSQEKFQDCLHVNFLKNQENQKGKGPDWMFDLDLLTPSMNYIPVRKENYADSKEQGISCDDVEDLDDQQFIVHTAQPMHPEERTAAKEVPLSSEEQALHDELVSLMHQESLAKAHNDDQRIAFEEEKKRIAIAKGKEHSTVLSTLSSCKYNHLKVLREIHHMILMKTPKEVFSLQTPFDAEGGGVDRLQHLDPYH